MKYTIADLMSDFPTDDSCLDWLVNYLYPHGIFCIQCDRSTKHTRVKGRKTYACQRCSWQVSPMKGTIFENTHVPLKSWFLAIYLMATNKAGTSAKQIEREVGVSYPTAWKMMHDIRSLMQPPDKQLAGEVEIDETYLHANTYKRSSARKRYGFDARRTGEVVVGMVERGGAVKVWHVKAAGARVLHPLIARNVRQGTLIHTDGYIAYRSLPRMGYQHRWTEHGKGEYYREDSYTQNIENVWSHFKRGIKGVYRHIGPKYVQAYANEYAWRYSNRKRANMFWALMCRIDKR